MLHALCPLRVGRVVLLWAMVLLAAGIGCTRNEVGDAQEEAFQTHYRLGMRYMEHGQPDRAEEEFRRGLEMAPDHMEVSILLAQALSAQDKWFETSQRVQWIMERGNLEDISVPMRMRLGRLLTRPQGTVPNLEEAKRQFEKVLERDPSNVLAAYQLGLVELGLGRFSEAAELFETLNRKHPQNLGGHYYAGVAHMRDGDYRRAIPLLRRALEMKPESLEAKWLLDLCLAGEGGLPANLDGEHRIGGPEREKAREPAVQFTDVATAAGVAKIDGGRGSAWGDYDNDGDLDILAVGNYAPHALFRNNGDGTFTDVAVEAGLADPRGGWAALLADYDNDGDLDLYVTRDGWFGQGPNTLYRNRGDGTFEDVTREAGVGDGGSSFCAAFGDYDNDGYLDLYIADGVVGDGSPNVLYRNNGDGTFTDVAAEAGVAHTGRGIGVAFGDYEGDGYLDIHLVNLAEPNVLYHNNGDGTFTEVTREAGLTSPIQRGFMTFFFDYDNDRDLDIFISAHCSFSAFLQSKIRGRAGRRGDPPVLYRNNGDGTFTDVTVEAGLYRSFGSMGANFGDMDNDGYLDLYLANGGPDMGRLEPNTLLHNNGDGTFTDITDVAGVGNLGKGHGATFGDYDSDGDLDLYVPVGGAYVGDQWPNCLYRNRGNANNWLIVKTMGTRSNRDGIGAKVTVVAGGWSSYAEVSGGCGFGSTNSLPLEFGLGAREQADRVEILWPSGLVQTLENVSANQILTVTER